MKKIYFCFLIFSFVGILKSQTPDFTWGGSYSYIYTGANKKVDLIWDFQNAGGTTNTTFTIAYIASTDMTLDPGDYIIDTKSYAGSLANVLQSITYTRTFGSSELANGNYNFIVYIDFGNNISESDETNNVVKFGSFNFVGDVGIKENRNADNYFSIYPNPANEALTIKNISNSNLEINAIKLYNIEGKEVMSRTKSETEMFDTNKFSLDAVPSGIYFVKISSSNNITYSKKIVIEK